MIVFYLTGLCGDMCVFYSAMDSLNARFETFIIEDGTCPLNKEDYIKTNKAFTENGGKIILSKEVF